MKKLFLALSLLTFPANAADYEVFMPDRPPLNVTVNPDHLTQEDVTILDRVPRHAYHRARYVYTNVLIMDTVLRKCSDEGGFEDLQYREVPDVNPFTGIDPAAIPAIKKLSRLEAKDRSIAQIRANDLEPDQVSTESAWCRLSGTALLDEAQANLEGTVNSD